MARTADSALDALFSGGPQRGQGRFSQSDLDEIVALCRDYDYPDPFAVLNKVRNSEFEDMSRNELCNRGRLVDWLKHEKRNRTRGMASAPTDMTTAGERLRQALAPMPSRPSPPPLIGTPEPETKDSDIVSLIKDTGRRTETAQEFEKHQIPKAKRQVRMQLATILEKLISQGALQLDEVTELQADKALLRLTFVSEMKDVTIPETFELARALKEALKYRHAPTLAEILDAPFPLQDEEPEETPAAPPSENDHAT